MDGHIIGKTAILFVLMTRSSNERGQHPRTRYIDSTCPYLPAAGYRSLYCSQEVEVLKASEVLRRAKKRATEKNWLPFEAIDIEAGRGEWGRTRERQFLTEAIRASPYMGWETENLPELFDRAISLVEEEEAKK